MNDNVGTEVEDTSIKNITNEYNKIGGWLIFMAILLAFAPLNFLSFTVNNLLPWFSPQNYTTLVAKNPLAPTLIIFEIVENIFFMAFLIFLNVLFYRRRKNFPKFMITYRVLQLVFFVVDQIMIYSLGLLKNQPLQPVIGNIIGNIIFGVLLIVYLLKSKRVKGTFVVGS